MATQIDSSSPFTGVAGNSQEAPAATEEFSIRTMQDDLLALQKKGGQPPRVPENQPLAKAPEFERIVPEPPKKQPAAKIEVMQTAQPLPEKKPLPKPEYLGEEPLYIKPVPEAVKPPVDTKNTIYKITLTILIVLIVAVIGLGGYYFWTTRAPKTAEPQTPIETPQQPEVPAVIVAPVEKYSSEKPNFLSLDLAALFPEDITQAITDIASELGTKAAQAPYEFVVVDSTNTPVTFSVFAAATKLNLSAAVLNDLGNTFSLYIYSDNGATRLAVAITTDKKEALATEMTQQEKTFVVDADFLFLDTKPEATIGTFNSTAYNNTAIRYINLATSQPLSIDYAITGTKLIIATSKNAMHAVLDKITTEASASPAPQPASPDVTPDIPAAANADSTASTL